MELKGRISYETTWKRFYTDIQFYKECPRCTYDNEINLNEIYLEYPKFNKCKQYYFCCKKCNYEFNVYITLKNIISTIEVTNEKII